MEIVRADGSQLEVSHVALHPAMLGHPPHDHVTKIAPGNCIIVVYRYYRWCWPLQNSGRLRLKSPDPPEPSNGR